MLSDAQRHKEKQTKARWEKVDRYYAGAQTRFSSSDTKSGEKWKADTKTNHIYAFDLSMKAVLMRDLPSIDPTARVTELEPQADMLREIIRSGMLRNEFPEREEELLDSGNKYGRAALKTTWDKRMNAGAGDWRIDVVSAKNLVLQPGKTRLRDCAYIFETQMMDRVTLLLMYPHLREKILRLYTPGEKKNSLIDPLLSDQQPMEGTHTDGTGFSLYFPLMGAADPKEALPVVEFWALDPETIEKYAWVFERDGTGYKTVKRKKNERVYPTGRYIRFCGDVIFEDRPNPFPSFPYSEYINMSQDGAEWPMGEFDQLIPIQDVYDVSRNQLVDIMNQVAAGGQKVFGPTANLKPDILTNRPGAWIPTNDPEAIKALDGTRAPGEAFTNLEKIIQDFDRVSGFPEAIMGSDMADVRSGVAIETLNEMARGRLKLKTYSMECCFRDMARKITDLVGVYYIRGIHYPAHVDLVGVRSDWFEYTVRAGLNLPASKRTQEQFLLNLFDRAAAVMPQLAPSILKYIIEQSDLPNKEQFIAEMQNIPAPMNPPDLQVVGGQGDVPV